jgi:hypothetical protein
MKANSIMRDVHHDPLRDMAMFDLAKVVPVAFTETGAPGITTPDRWHPYGRTSSDTTPLVKFSWAY